MLHCQPLNDEAVFRLRKQDENKKRIFKYFRKDKEALKVHPNDMFLFLLARLWVQNYKCIHYYGYFMWLLL